MAPSEIERTRGSAHSGELQERTLGPQRISKVWSSAPHLNWICMSTRPIYYLISRLSVKRSLGIRIRSTVPSNTLCGDQNLRVRASYNLTEISYLSQEKVVGDIIQTVNRGHVPREWKVIVAVPKEREHKGTNAKVLCKNDSLNASLSNRHRE